LEESDLDLRAPGPGARFLQGMLIGFSRPGPPSAPTAADRCALSALFLGFGPPPPGVKGRQPDTARAVGHENAGSDSPGVTNITVTAWFSRDNGAHAAVRIWRARAST